MLRRLAKPIVAAASLAALSGRVSAEPAPFMMQATLAGRQVEGQPLAWDQKHMLLLGRDGSLYDFDPAEAKDAKKTAAQYLGYTTSELKALLRDEFDRRYAISTTTH